MKAFTTSILLPAVIFVTGFLISPEAEAYHPPADTSIVHSVVDVLPELVGGLDALYAAMDVPASVQSGYLEGRVFLKFVVDEKGRVIQARILKDIGDNCGEIALNAVKSMQFTPGRLNHIPVKVVFTMPVLFQAEKFERVSEP